jgi:hypothetical protein
MEAFVNAVACRDPHGKGMKPSDVVKGHKDPDSSDDDEMVNNGNQDGGNRDLCSPTPDASLFRTGSSSNAFASVFGSDSRANSAASASRYDPDDYFGNHLTCAEQRENMVHANRVEPVGYGPRADGLSFGINPLIVEVHQTPLEAYLDKDADSIQSDNLPIVFTIDAAYRDCVYHGNKDAGEKCVLLMKKLNMEYNTWSKVFAEDESAQTRQHHIPFPLELPTKATVKTTKVIFDLEEGLNATHSTLASFRGQHHLLSIDEGHMYPASHHFPRRSDAGHEPLVHGFILSARLVKAQNTSCMPVSVSFAPTCTAVDDAKADRFRPMALERINAETVTENRDDWLYIANKDDAFLSPEAARIMRIEPRVLLDLAKGAIRRSHTDPKKARVEESQQDVLVYLPESENGGEDALYMPKKGNDDLLLWFAVTYIRQIRKKSIAAGVEPPKFVPTQSYAKGDGSLKTKQQHLTFNYMAFNSVVTDYCAAYDPIDHMSNFKTMAAVITPRYRWSEALKIAKQHNSAFATKPVAISAQVEISYIPTNVNRWNIYKSPSAPRPDTVYKADLTTCRRENNCLQSWVATKSD